MNDMITMNDLKWNDRDTMNSIVSHNCIQLTIEHKHIHKLRKFIMEKYEYIVALIVLDYQLNIVRDIKFGVVCDMGTDIDFIKIPISQKERDTIRDFTMSKFSNKNGAIEFKRKKLKKIDDIAIQEVKDKESLKAI